MPTLETTIELAVHLHKGQKDKAGAPYILHPLRVMLSMQDEAARIVAVLHDTIEDCGITIDDLRSLGYSEQVLEALDYLTKRREEEDDYDAFIERIRSGPPIARAVKLADLRDNSDISRIVEPTEWDFKRLEKYKRAIRRLEGAL